MNYATLLARSALRNRSRSALTVLGIMASVLAFVFLRTVMDAWYLGVEHAAQDRLATRHRVSFTLPLPVAHLAKIRDLPGVTQITHANWFGAVYPRDERSFFANLAVDGETYFQVYDEVAISPEHLSAWRADRAGAIVGEVLARKHGWKLGDRVTLRGTIYPGDWTFTVRGTYTTTRKTFDKSTFFFHWGYLNDAMPEVRKDQIGWIGIRVDDPSRGPDVARAVDNLFASSDAETLTESERAFNLGFLAMFGAVLVAIDVVSLVILVIMLMIVGNTIAMGVRERTHEYGVLRAIGFRPRHLALLVIGETALLALLGGALGLAVAIPFVDGFGKIVEEHVGNFFPYFSVTRTTTVAAFAATLAVGIAAALLPALRAARLPIVQALRRLG